MTVTTIHNFLESILEQRTASLEEAPSVLNAEREEFRRLCRIAEWMQLNTENLNIRLLSMESPLEDNTILPSRVRITLEVGP